MSRHSCGKQNKTFTITKVVEMSHRLREGDGTEGKTRHEEIRKDNRGAGNYRIYNDKGKKL